MNLVNILIGPIVELVKGYTERKQEAKRQQQEIDGKLQEKKLEQISKSEDYAQAFRLAQVETAGWRPGFWTIVLAAPVILCFCGKTGAHIVQQGFLALDTSTPDWFQYLLGIAVTSAFGYSVADKAYEWWKAP